MKKIRFLQLFVCIYGLVWGVQAQTTAKVSFVKGDVTITENGKAIKVSKDNILPLSSKVKTGESSGLTLLVDGQPFFVSGNQEITIQEAFEKSYQKIQTFSTKVKRKFKLTAITTPDVKAGNNGFKRGKKKYWKLLKEENYKQIIAELNKPEAIGENYVLGIACFMEGNYEQAVKNLKQVSVFSLAKESKESVFTKLAYSYSALGDYEQAIKTLKKVESIKSPSIYQMLIENYEYLFDDKNVEQYKDKLKKEFPENE